jgi:hypothetical protein
MPGEIEIKSTDPSDLQVVYKPERAKGRNRTFDTAIFSRMFSRKMCATTEFGSQFAIKTREESRSIGPSRNHPRLPVP